MATVRVWEGSTWVVCGNEYTRAEHIEFDGEEIGSVWEEGDARGVHTVFYRRHLNGAIVVHQMRWSRWEGEPTYAYVYTFPSLEAAKVMFAWELEQARLIPPHTAALDEVTDR